METTLLFGKRQTRGAGEQGKICGSHGWFTPFWPVRKALVGLHLQTIRQINRLNLSQYFRQFGEYTIALCR